MRSAGKLLALILAFVMVLGMLPAASAHFVGDELMISIGEPGMTVYLRFTPEVTAAYTFASHDTDWRDPQGYLYDAEMNLLAKHEDNGFDSELGYNDLNFTLVYTMEAGTTYILATNLYNVNYIGEFLVTLTADLSALHNYVGVFATEWYGSAVLRALENGITKGISPTEFGVTRICNRAQVVTFLYRTLIR